jgi:arginine decarboxylase
MGSMTDSEVLDLTSAHHHTGFRIDIRTGVGRGPTELAAFDAALRDANIANFNLIVLSSVIPPGTTVDVLDDVTDHTPPGEWGDRLYVVMAERRTSVPGQGVSAGIGWVQDEISGQGLFVEHHGREEWRVRQDIQLSLDSMVQGRPQRFGPTRTMVETATCTDGTPTCALVVAVYESQGWTKEPQQAR